LVVATGYPAAASRLVTAVAAPIDGGVRRAGGTHPQGIGGSGRAVESFRSRQREVDDVSAVGRAGVDPDDADRDRACGHGQGENMPGMRAGGLRDDRAEHHRQSARSGVLRR